MGREDRDDAENDTDGPDPRDAPQRILDVAAGRYRERCEPLPHPPTDGAEVVWMVGLPAAGKTAAATRLPGRRRIGIDDVREELGLDFDDPGWVTDAYDLAVGRLVSAVADGHAVVFDSTGLNLYARQQVLTLAEERAVPVRALFIDTPISTCRQRQIAKGRTRYNPFFDHCVALLIRALRTDLPEEVFTSYHIVSGTGEEESSKGEC